MRWAAIALFAGVAAVAVQACNLEGKVLLGDQAPGGASPSASISGSSESSKTVGGGFPVAETITGSMGGDPGIPPDCFNPTKPCICEPEHLGQLCVCDTAPEPMSSCNMACSMGFCTMYCAENSYCNLQCDIGCNIGCEPFTTCIISCGSDCYVHCQANAYCSVSPSMNGPVQMWCDAGAICDCQPTFGCVCSGPGCMQMP